MCFTRISFFLIKIMPYLSSPGYLTEENHKKQKKVHLHFKFNNEDRFHRSTNKNILHLCICGHASKQNVMIFLNQKK